MTSIHAYFTEAVYAITCLFLLKYQVQTPERSLLTQLQYLDSNHHWTVITFCGLIYPSLSFGKNSITKENILWHQIIYRKYEVRIPANNEMWAIATTEMPTHALTPFEFWTFLSLVEIYSNNKNLWVSLFI